MCYNVHIEQLERDVIIVHHWEQVGELFKLDCTKEEFCNKAAEIADCDPEDIEQEWVIMEVGSLEETTIEQMWREI